MLDSSGDEKEEEVLAQSDTLGQSSDNSSTRSEYGFGGDDGDTADPTPLAPSPVIVPMKETAPPIMVPKSYYGQPSTSSSTSSPLALATPILATSLAEDSAPPIEMDTTLKRRSTTKSYHVPGNEPQVTVTPPLTPSMGSTSLHRRHSSVVHKQNAPSGSASPHIASMPPSSKTTPSSIKDFEIIKPISKGAFGSVFLAKKKVTGDYYAIKVLKKSDMIAKNQITNVKAERMILMKQGESPFVVKLLWTFQSRDNLYLVMEYLNGGDCAALIKAVGSLPEEWTRNYIAEVTLGLEYLHQRGVSHR
jgi:serine/threonine-protein kinase RIM15